MDQDTQAALAEHIDKGQDIIDFYRLRERQWNYYNDLATSIKISSLPSVLVKLHTYVCAIRETQLMYYKRLKFKITSLDTFQCIDDE